MAFIITGIVEPEKQPPKAVAVAQPENGVVGSVVKLNAFSSSDPDGHELTYKWEFLGVPIGSSVVQEGFRQLDDDGALVTFSPDVVGDYSVKLTVSNGLFEDTDSKVIGIRAIMVPHGQGIVPDGKFIWSYIRDVWQQVDGKEWFETLWSALIQIAGAELLKLYQVDFNKSIRDIQDLCQRRWQPVRPRLDLIEDDCSFYLGYSAAGTGATTENLGLEAKAVLLAKDNVVVIRGAVLPNVFDQKLTVAYSRNPDNIGSYALVGLNQAKNGYALSEKLADETADRILQGVDFTFDFQSKAWHFGKDAKRLSYAERMAKYDFEPDQLIYFEGQGGYTYTKGTASVNGAAVTLTGATLVTDRVLPGYFIGFGSKRTEPLTVWDAQQKKNVVVDPGVTAWFEIKSVDGEGNLTLASNAGVVPNGDYCIVRDAMEFNVRVGDVVYYPSGINAGFYLVTKAAGNYIEVDRAPNGASTDNAGILAAVYRPVPITVSQPDTVTTGTFAVPMRQAGDLVNVASGRVICVGGRTFTLLRAVNDIRQEIPLTLVMTNEGDLVSNQKSLPWRVPHTLVSKSQDFEALGVSPGDLLLFDVTNGVSQTHSEVRAQVVGVVGNKLGFVLSDEPVNAGVVPAVPTSTYETLSKDFGIQRVGKSTDGSMLLTGDAKAIVDVLNTTGFKRRYWNQPLTSSTDFEVLGGSFRVHPKAIIRNTRVPVESTLRSIPLLQERIAPKDEQTVVVSENLDYVIDGGVIFTGDMTFRSGTDLLDVEGGHFIGRGLMPGDEFEIETPAAIAGKLRVVRVLDDERVKLSRTIPHYDLADPVTAHVTIRRGSKGSFLRFYPGTFTAKSPVPDRLWAEMALYDNADAIEKNFGILVGLTKNDLEKVSKDINYRQAVAGLMFAYTRGSAMNKLRLGAQILLGLPFSEHAGIVRSIENDYRLDAQGRAVLGRILIEDIDVSGKPQGTQRVYTFPLDPQSEKLSGIETNPATGKPYQVGDTVEIFSALCKGVEVNDYLTTPLPASLPAQLHLQQFHTFRVRANDNIFSFEEMQLVSQFLRRITPSYIAYVIQMATELQDGVSITDVLRIAILNRDVGMLADNIGTHLPFALTWDGRSYDGKWQIRWGDGAFWIRKTGKDLTTFSKGHNRNDPDPSTVPTIVEVSDAEGIRVGDILFILEGDDQGVYPIIGVNGTQLTVAGADAGFQDNEGKDVLFAIGRPVQAIIRSGSAEITGSWALVEPGLVQDGVAVGDWFVSGGKRAVVKSLAESDVGSGVTDMVELDTALPVASGAGYFIIRPALMGAPYIGITATLTSNGAGYAIDNPNLLALADPGDELKVLQDGIAALAVLDPKAMVIQPVLPAGAYQVQLLKRGYEALGFGTLDKWSVWDELQLTLKNAAGQSQATCTNGSADVSVDTSTGVKPGDLFQIRTGANSTVDQGYGPGVYPVVGVTAGKVTLSHVLTASGAVDWAILRRR